MSDELDDLFRQQLDGHATPPDAALRQRLAELAAAERLDARFRAGLGAHVSAPRRELWERLEDEHLRPVARRRRPAVAWWQLSAAALVLLGLLVGGGLWRVSNGRRAADELAGRQAPTRQAAGTTAPTSTPNTTRNGAPGTAATAAVAATTGQPNPRMLPQQPAAAQSGDPNTTRSSVARATTDRLFKKNKFFAAPQATSGAAAPSSRSVATAGRPPRRTAPAGATRERLLKTNQQGLGPDAVPASLATIGGQPTPAKANPATSKRPVELTTSPTAPVLAATAPAPEVIEVEVRRGPATDRPAPAALVAAADPEPASPRRPRLRLGGLLRQAGHLARGEQLSLAEATGPAESLTLQARLGDHTVSKTIQF